MTILPGAARNDDAEGLRRRIETLEGERKRLRDALAAAEGNFHSAFHATPAGMSLSRVDTGKIVDMNAAFLRILGYEHGEVLGRTSDELGLWTSGDQRASLVAELRAKGQVVAREERMRRKDGTVVTVLFSAVPAAIGGVPHTITWVLDITARVATEASLAASEARWRTLVAQAPVVIMMLAPDATVLTANRSVSGRPVADLIGRKAFEFLSPAHRDEAARIHQDVLATRAPQRMEAAIDTPGGRRLWVEAQISPVSEGGDVRSVILVLSDITARRESEARWRTLVTQAPVTISLIDRDGTVLYINRSLTGRPADEMIGRPIYDFVGEETAAISRVKVGEAFETGLPSRFDVSMPTVGGGKVYAQATLAPVVIEGKVSSVIAVVTDTTAQFEARQALVESERRFRDIVESMGDWYWEMDAAGRITRSSEHCLAVIGRTPAQMLGHSPVEFAAPDDAALQRQYLAEHGTPPRPIRDFVGWYLHPDGRRVSIAVSGVPVFAHDGNLAGWRGVARDVTARMLAEEERRAIEAKMQQAQKLESLGILAGGIAHDFNNLLTAVLGNADLALAELPPAAAARESVEQIQKAALHAAELTRQMLAYAGRGHIAMQSVSVQDVVRDIAHLLGSSISKRHALSLDLAETTPAVEADPAQVRQIVMNLVINASEAIGDREGKIDVRTAMLGPGVDVPGDAAIGDLAQGRHVLLEVSDTGAGMDAASLSRIFDPFFSTKFAGRGLGLAAVLGIVRRHGGALRVRSRPDAGATFSVLLPAKDTAGPAPTSAGTGNGASIWRSAGAILLVDDEESVRSTTSRMLRAMGFETVLAGDGEEAIALLGAGKDRLRAVLLDLTMPRMDGEETLRGMRAIAPDLPVVLCSGYNVLERQGRFADLAFSGFLQKPFRFAELQQALRRALGE